MIERLQHCQRADVLGDHSTLERVRGRLHRGLGIKSGFLHLLHPEAPREILGAPSKYAVGDWVRVLDREALGRVLDDHHKTRGLLFTETQFDYVGLVMRVSMHVRRMRDDRGKYRPISRTVLLEGADCGGLREGVAGCGRACPLMFRDEWLEPAQPPIETPVPHLRRRHALVRSYDQIAETLDVFGRRDGVTFMPEMRQYAGKRFPIMQTVPLVYEYDHWLHPRAQLYILDQLRCSGAICAGDGPCDRRCRLVWHSDWLDLDPETT